MIMASNAQEHKAAALRLAWISYPHLLTFTAEKYSDSFELKDFTFVDKSDDRNVIIKCKLCVGHKTFFPAVKT